MTSVALPRALVSPPPISGDDRIKSLSVKVNPANASGATTFGPDANNRLVFNIPSYGKSFVNPKRSYLSFTIKTSADTRVLSGAPWVDRMTLKAGSVMVEDIQDYAVLERMLSNFEGKDYSESRAWLTADYDDKFRASSNVAAAALSAELLASHVAGRTYEKPLLSGVMGRGQTVYVPIGMMNSGGSHAMQLELYLADHTQVVARTSGSGTATYEISNVSLNLELQELPERAIDAFNTAINQGGQVTLPYTTYRSYRQYAPSGQTSVNFNVVDNSKNAEQILLAMRKQSDLSAYVAEPDWTNATTPAVRDVLSFVGGTQTDTVLSKFIVRYADRQYPQQPVENINDSLPTILNTLSSLDMLGKAPRLLSSDLTLKPVFEETGFCVVQGFKTSEDDILNGLNTASSGSPIELQLDFSAQTNNVALFSFVKSALSLNISDNGSVSMLQGRGM